MSLKVASRQNSNGQLYQKQNQTIFVECVNYTFSSSFCKFIFDFENWVGNRQGEQIGNFLKVHCDFWKDEVFQSNDDILAYFLFKQIYHIFM